MATCQICGREIKAGNGRIAAHGYQRPGHGWQTASCFGAKYRPYEVACDAISKFLLTLERHIERAETLVENLTSNPPENFDVTRTDAYGRRSQIQKLAIRPENFNPTKQQSSFSSQSYESAFFSKVNNLKGQIKSAQAEILFLQKRLTDWKEIPE